jgi:Fe2+ or Zn2+ uptake regulation protein
VHYSQLIQCFKQHGVRHTKRREAVYLALQGTQSHPTAEEILDMVVGQGCSLSLATIYSSLDLFCRQGLVRRMSIRGRADRFDATTSSHLHLHLEDTGEVLDVPPDVSQRMIDSVDQGILRSIEDAMDIEVDEIEFHIVGHRRTPSSVNS